MITVTTQNTYGDLFRHEKVNINHSTYVKHPVRQSAGYF
jgi:hypothetical protein